MARTFINARLPHQTGLFKLRINAEGVLEKLKPMSAKKPSKREVDLKGDWVSLGGVDLQINGALGLAFPDLAIAHIPKLTQICQFLWEHGVDGFLPTLVTSSLETIHRALGAIATVSQAPSSPNSAQILGVHLEGPCLNPVKRGAHPAEFLQPLTLETVKHVLGDYASVVKVMTLAPELDASGDVIPYLRSLGITVSLGHSLATDAQARVAFEQGATMVTHAFNAMPSLHHREPGLLAAAILDPRVRCGLIADGEHVSPTIMDVLLRASGDEKGVFLVSDVLAPLGLPDGVYPWDSRQIEVRNGTARLPDGTLSGTTVGLLVGAQNLVKWGVCTPDTAISLATEAPRQAIGLPGLTIGQPTSLLHWRYDIGTRSLTWKRLS
jgi:N-acetylglucosamine-6-phosphate deacetylase